MPKDYYVFFDDMLVAIDKIKRYVSSLSYDSFFEDEMRVDAVLRNLEVIGEEAGNIPPEIREKYPQIEWKKIVGLRNIIIHEYFGIDVEIIWDIIGNNLDTLRKDLEQAMLEYRDY